MDVEDNNTTSIEVTQSLFGHARWFALSVDETNLPEQEQIPVGPIDDEVRTSLENSVFGIPQRHRPGARPATLRDPSHPNLDRYLNEAA